jgi:hypothetical protein
MRRTYSAAVLALVLAGQMASGQVVPSLPAPDLQSPTQAYADQSLCLGSDFLAAPDRCRPSFWGGVEYQLWWTKGTNLPPLLTRGNPADPIPGALGQPGTQVLFGGNQSYGDLNGIRISLGGWFQGNLGWEASGFVFGRRSFNFAAGSDAVGNPPLYFPIFRPDVGREGSLTLAEPFNPNTGFGGFNGNVSVVSQSRLWGQEANFLFDLGEVGRWHVNVLAGFRYLDLQESLTINTFLNDNFLDIQRNIQDSFSTRSQFYGGQIGFKANTTLGERLSVDVIGKLALGSTHNVVNVTGVDNVSGAGFGPPASFAEGVFTQTSNIGRRTANSFSAVPQIQLKLGYDIVPGVRVTVGYDFLYWTRVVRAGEQVDHSVDVTQSVSLNGPPVPTAFFPRPLFERSDYWAQGVTFGLEFRY